MFVSGIDINLEIQKQPSLSLVKLVERGACTVGGDASFRSSRRERCQFIARELEDSHANMEEIKGREKKGRFFAGHGTNGTNNSAEISVTWVG